ncbi:Protein SPA1-RELATED 2 [Bienertia sinuspersici]
MTSNNNIEENKDGSDLPSKQEDFPMLALPVIYDSRRGQLHGIPGLSHTDSIGNVSSEQCGITISGLEPPCVSTQSTEYTGNVVKTFKMENYNDQVLDITKIPSNKDVHLRKGQWPHLHQMVGAPKHPDFFGGPLLRVKEKFMHSVGEDSRRSGIDAWNIKNDETERVCADVMHGKNPNSDNASLPQDARLKVLSTSSFSQFFGKKNAKGKGVVCGQLGDKTNNDSAENLESNTRMFSTSGMTSDVQMQRCSGGSLNHGVVNLREWLMLGIYLKDKVESLNIFRQIVELVNAAHSQGVVLQQLWPSYFIIMSSNKLKYIGSSTQVDLPVSNSLFGCKKRPPEEDINAFCTSDVKQQKVSNRPSSVTLKTGVSSATFHDYKCDMGSSSGFYNHEHRGLSMPSCQASRLEKSPLAEFRLEEKWYACPEELDAKACKLSSNIYSLGVLLFELLCSFDSLETHSSAMFDMHHRILPPKFLSENPKEAAFCLWLIHPIASSRPTISLTAVAALELHEQAPMQWL